MSYVEMVNMLMPAVANGAAMAARIPVMLKSKTFSTFRARQPSTACQVGGTIEAGTTKDNSALVRVADQNDASPSQSGNGEVAENRQIANSSASKVSVNCFTAAVWRHAIQKCAR